MGQQSPHQNKCIVDATLRVVLCDTCGLATLCQGTHLRHCPACLCALGTTIEEDQALLANASRGLGVGSTLSEIEQAAIAFRVEKKKVLVSCLKSLGVEMGSGTGAGSSGAAGDGGKKKTKGFA